MPEDRRSLGVSFSFKNITEFTKQKLYLPFFHSAKVSSRTINVINNVWDFNETVASREDALHEQKIAIDNNAANKERKRQKRQSSE